MQQRCGELNSERLNVIPADAGIGGTMKRFLKWCYIFIFFAVCCIPVYTMPFLAESESAEKRELQERPDLWEDGKLNPEYTKKMDQWLSDHFSFRSRLAAGFSMIKASLFATSSEDSVIIGREDWLYFAETLDDYMQQRVLSEEELVRIRKILTLVDEYVASQGGKFLFFVAPNKNTIYPEYMPYYYPRGTGKSSLERLSSVLDGSSFYLDISAVLKEKKASWQQDVSASNHSQWLYYQRDSHWNDYGAAVVFESIMDWRESMNGNHGSESFGAFGQMQSHGDESLEQMQSHEDESLEQAQSHIDWLSQEYQMTMNRVGDLEQMLFPKGGKLDWQVSWENPPEFSYASSFHSPEDLLIHTVNEKKEGNLLMFRDSFGNNLYPFMAGEYGNAEFSRIVPYRLFLMEENPYDTVIIELAERNLSTLLTAAPMLLASRRTTIEAVECEDAVVYLREVSGMLHVYGTMDYPCSGSILIAAAQDGVTAYYEAFPVLEQKLLTEAGEEVDVFGGETTGFSAYLPLEYEEGTVWSIFREE